MLGCSNWLPWVLLLLVGCRFDVLGLREFGWLVCVLELVCGLGWCLGLVARWVALLLVLVGAFGLVLVVVVLVLRLVNLF